MYNFLYISSKIFIQVGVLNVFTFVVNDVSTKWRMLRIMC